MPDNEIKCHVIIYARIFRTNSVLSNYSGSFNMSRKMTIDYFYLHGYLSDTSANDLYINYHRMRVSLIK